MNKKGGSASGGAAFFYVRGVFFALKWRAAFTRNDARRPVGLAVLQDCKTEFFQTVRGT
jgi:hypothetical protein